MLAVCIPRSVPARHETTGEVGQFLQSLYAKHERELHDRFEREWRVAIANGLPETTTNRERFLRVRFVYELARHGGILGNTFLVREEDGRHPDTMLRDAFAERPAYQLSYSSGWEGSASRARNGVVFTFGRCDEFEMEQSAELQRVFGIPARIAMLTENHVVTEVPMEGGYLRLDASYLRCYAFARARIRDAPPGRWRVQRCAYEPTGHAGFSYAATDRGGWSLARENQRLNVPPNTRPLALLPIARPNSDRSHY